MIAPDLMLALRQRIDAANAPLASVVARCQEQADRTIRHADRVIEHVGLSTSKRDLAPDTERHARVMEAFRQRDFSGLSFGDRRYASKRFEDATPAQMKALLDAFPGCWAVFAAECFSKFEAFQTARENPGYVRLLARAPESVGFLHGSFRVGILLTPEGPTHVAQFLKSTELCDARDELAALAFSPRWEYTAIALALWARMRVDRGESTSALWAALTRDPQVQAMVLPPVQGSNLSWFSPVPRPAGYRSPKSAQAVFISSVFRSKGLEPYWGEFTEKLLASEFGDPRLAAISEGWERLRAFDQSYYDWFLEFLITQDLEVFFQHAMSDERREKFWKQYLKSIRRTVCVLDRETHRRLTTLLGTSDPKLAGSMSRARVFSKKSGAHAFCLFFDSIVVVEFSEQGNAAYVYSRSAFDRLFEKEVRFNLVPNHNALKDKDSANSRIVHMGANWEESASRQLTAFDIIPDRWR